MQMLRSHVCSGQMRLFNSAVRSIDYRSSLISICQNTQHNTVHATITLTSSSLSTPCACSMIVLKVSMVMLSIACSVMYWCVDESQDNVSTRDQKLGRKAWHTGTKSRAHSWVVALMLTLLHITDPNSWTAQTERHHTCRRVRRW